MPGLTDESPMDMNELLQEALTEVSGDEGALGDDAQVDPSDQLEGQLDAPGDDDDALAEDDDDASYDGGDDDPLAADDGDDLDDEGDEDEQLEDEPPAEEPKDDQLADLKKRLEETLEANRQLMALVTQQAQAQQQPKEQQQPKATRAEIAQFEEAVRLARFGGTKPEDQKAWEGLPAHVRRDALRHVEEVVRQETRYGLDPTQRYAEQIAPHVEKAIQAAVLPLQQELHNHRIDAWKRSHGDFFDSDENQQLVLAEVQKIPGGNDWATLRQRLDLAVQSVRSQQERKLLGKEKQRNDADRRQRQANKKARRGQRGRGRGNRGRRKPEFAEVPVSGDMSEAILQWSTEFAQLEQEGALGD